MALIARIVDLVGRHSQFIIVTHSPILPAPSARRRRVTVRP
jgi:predicted ATPase